MKNPATVLVFLVLAAAAAPGCGGASNPRDANGQSNEADTGDSGGGTPGRDSNPDTAAGDSAPDAAAGDSAPDAAAGDSAPDAAAGDSARDAAVGDSDSAPACTASCDGKVCGSDGCGGSCGTCPGLQVCSDLGACVAVAGDGLLSGCTVSEETNTTGCPIPAGWTVVNQESFAGGHINGAGNPSVVATNLTDVPGGISPSGAHTGSYGLACLTTGEQSFCNYNVYPGAAKEVYMSYWQYLGDNAVATLDFYLAKLQNSRGRDFRFDPNPPPGLYQTRTTQYQVYSEGDGLRSIACYSETGCTAGGQGKVSGERYWNISPGWHQWEVWVKYSTCDGTTPVPDGFFHAYLNGRKVMSIVDMNTTLCPSLADDATVKAQVGGYQSVQAFLNKANQCVPYGSSEYDHPMHCRPRFTDCPQFMADGLTPCWGNQQPYKRHLDDVIILKR